MTEALRSSSRASTLSQFGGVRRHCLAKSLPSVRFDGAHVVHTRTRNSGAV